MKQKMYVIEMTGYYEIDASESEHSWIVDKLVFLNKDDAIDYIYTKYGKSRVKFNEITKKFKYYPDDGEYDEYVSMFLEILELHLY